MARDMEKEIAGKVEDARTNRASEAYQTLRGLIVRGGLAPGARLRETELARKLGVSRTPVREALSRLEYEGFVRTQRGEARREATVVASLTKRDARELFYLVGALEGVAARWAAQLPTAERNGLCDSLSRANRAFMAAAGDALRDAPTLMALDGAFHQKIVEPTAGVRLLGTWEALKPHTVRYTWAYRDYFAEHAKEAAGDHEAIIEAIRRGDPDEADRAAAANYWNGALRISTIMTVAGEQR